MPSTDPGPGFQLGDTAIPSTLGPIGVNAPAVRASDLLGGHRTVDTLVERDAIHANYRDEGMTVWVTGTGELYRLNGGILDADWDLQTSSSALIGGFVRTFLAGVVLGDVAYQTGVAGQVGRADASAVATANPLGVVAALDFPTLGECVVVPSGLDVAGYLGLVIGSRYILAAAPGLIVAEGDTGNINYPAYLTPGSGEALAPVGVARSATELAVNTAPGVLAVG